jgi:hypothetical protein
MFNGVKLLVKRSTSRLRSLDLEGKECGAAEDIQHEL